MKRRTIPVKAFKQILEEFIEIKKINPPNSKGLKHWGDKREKLQNGDILEAKFLSNWYSKLEKLQPSDIVTFYEEKLIGVFQDLNYSGVDDFLKKNRFSDDTGNLLPIKDLKALRSLNPPHPNEWIDKYTLSARFIPSIIALSNIPIFLSILSISKEVIPNFIVLIVLGLFVTVANGISGWISTKGKTFQDKYFSLDKLGLPTSYLMLFDFDSKYSENQKVEYRDKVKAFFDLCLKSKPEEIEDKFGAVQLLSEAGIKVKDNVKSNIIRSCNIRYGQIRNLIPATIIGAIISLLCVLIGIVLNDMLIVITSAIMAIALISWHLHLRYGKSLRIAAETYATYLINEFLSR
ncbi:hypothetical protein QQ008_07815 [Fulvivirgaceae bacterium BMA10]|uniref:Uncharacterized protein n=1 Tax=Splendidivirga corallicola TaxID=3051826 RepID=A0ABT8KKM3_9BACT|nr:hypothetical protein [Fulvivirgaceae bacterium BMA10]